MGSDDEEWQVVKPKGRKGQQRLAAILTQEAVNEQTKAGTPPKTSLLDVASIAADHEKLCSRWRNSPSYSALRTIITDNAARHATIRTAICLGLGSFDVKDHSSRHSRSSHDAHAQLEAFRVVVGILEEQSGHPIKCYAQEPSFGPSDREYCETLGIEVVDTPHAFQYVRPDAFVFGIHLPHYAWGYALSDHLPGLYIGTDLKSLDRLNTTFRDDRALTAVIGRVEEMYAVADRYIFPSGERHTQLESTFSGTDILWSKKETNAASEEKSL
ncbi:hypothetical protein CONLIGDRAFT_679491 [Coniochaeta ligniaria NRRL 30616]|uniref:SRR1-like domain-containing protein n=1 Tax=Coniochaeta ligniaria NRRL 30616 TaxID=1408157 RepID=A0A1J7ITB2_9PEZI|nr:hypothetical protein CONLIGDRAFT_679491 [Coniochaeta ligniaria NRRL 30616]